jgi:hypothetical protein
VGPGACSGVLLALQRAQLHVLQLLKYSAKILHFLKEGRGLKAQVEGLCFPGMLDLLLVGH